MGLDLTVGLLADLAQDDPEDAAEFRAKLGRLGAYLLELGLPPHHEPETCEVWSADLPGYSGLHCLRRLAARLDLTGRLPSPGTEDSGEDPVLEGYFAAVAGVALPLRSRFAIRGRRFARGYDHLIVHSDAEGYYLPVDFPEVLFPPDELEIPGGMVGSTVRLLEETNRLARMLEIPPELHSQSDEIFEALESPAGGPALWQRYGTESYCCVVLREGCSKSLASGAALVFA